MPEMIHTASVHNVGHGELRGLAAFKVYCQPGTRFERIMRAMSAGQDMLTTCVVYNMELDVYKVHRACFEKYGVHIFRDGKRIDRDEPQRASNDVNGLAEIEQGTAERGGAVRRDGEATLGDARTRQSAEVRSPAEEGHCSGKAENRIDVQERDIALQSAEPVDILAQVLEMQDAGHGVSRIARTLNISRAQITMMIKRNRRSGNG